MLELHMAQGMKLDWLKTVYDAEKRGFRGYRVEWMKGKKEISVADKIKKKLFGSKILSGGDALWLPYTPGAINYVITTEPQPASINAAGSARSL